MSGSIHCHHKALIAPLRAAMVDFAVDNVKESLSNVFEQQAQIKMCHPFGDIAGPEDWYQNCFQPLLHAMPDLERRDFIVVAGDSSSEGQWLGCAGNYVGTFVRPWLDIPPTGHLTHMRFAEFYRFDGGRIVEVQAIWDIPEVMLQANAWPMTPSLGREIMVPGSASQDGLVTDSEDSVKSSSSYSIVLEMLEHLVRHPEQGGPELMELERYWHPRMNWYGPSGIGSCRGIAGFRHWHQIPFLKAMPDRGQNDSDIHYHFFADHNYVALTAWPGMRQTISADGWMGIAPTNLAITLCSLDFWRIENDLIRENWVLVDLLHVYQQIGIDVFERLREFNKARVFGKIPFPVGGA